MNISISIDQTINDWLITKKRNFNLSSLIRDLLHNYIKNDIRDS